MSLQDSSRFAIRPLDEKSVKVAEKELNEDQKRIKSDIECLRTWLRQHPYIKSIESMHERGLKNIN